MRCLDKTSDPKGSLLSCIAALAKSMRWNLCVEFERAIIQERIAAGMARAKANGTKSGKPIGRPRIAAPIKDRIRAAHRAGGASLRDLAAQFRVGRETVRRVLCGGD